MHARRAIVIGLVLPLLYLLTLGLGLVGAAHGGSFQRTCFPASRWNADPQYRPCVRITRVYEDGSFKFAISDHNGTVRQSGGVGSENP